MNDFFEMLVDAVTEFAKAMNEVVEIINEKTKAMRDEIFEVRADVLDHRAERRERREAALLAGQRAEARALAYDRQMQRDKARRVLRMRKRLHADGGLPDWQNGRKAG